LRYLMQTEVHAYALALAAAVLLSFVPFLIVIVSVCRHLLRWRAAVEAIYIALADSFPGQLADFIRRNVDVAVGRRPFQWTSLALLLIVANGVFEPLEVAMNRAWNVPKHRSYWRNQLISLGLILVCGVLALASTLFAAFNYTMWPRILGARSVLVETLGLAFFKMAAIPLSILALFLIYWLLPNRRIRPVEVAPAAIVVGLAMELLKYFNLLTWPLLQAKLAREYGPFVYSASIVIWSFLMALLVLAGAEWSARRALKLDSPRQEPGPIATHV